MAQEKPRPVLDLAALRDPRRPVSRIAEDLLPYLNLIVEEFDPQQLILFGSYAYGEPDQDSDVDLLVVKSVERSSLKESLAIRRRLRTLRAKKYVPIGLVIESPERHRARLAADGDFYSDINRLGLDLIRHADQ